MSIQAIMSPVPVGLTWSFIINLNKPLSLRVLVGFFIYSFIHCFFLFFFFFFLLMSLFLQ